MESLHKRIQNQTTTLINLAEQLLFNSGEDDDIRQFYKLILDRVVETWAVKTAVRHILFEIPDYFGNKEVVLERMFKIDNSKPIAALMNRCR